MSAKTKILENHGYLNRQDIIDLANDERMCLLLVRCNMGRFVVPAQDALHYVTMVDNSTPLSGDYVRDVSLYNGGK